jgi:hypothetical protein
MLSQEMSNRLAAIFEDACEASHRYRALFLATVADLRSQPDTGSTGVKQHLSGATVRVAPRLRSLPPQGAEPQRGANILPPQRDMVANQSVATPSRPTRALPVPVWGKGGTR